MVAGGCPTFHRLGQRRAKGTHWPPLTSPPTHRPAGPGGSDESQRNLPSSPASSQSESGTGPLISFLVFPLSKDPRQVEKGKMSSVESPPKEATQGLERAPEQESLECGVSLKLSLAGGFRGGHFCTQKHPGRVAPALPAVPWGSDHLHSPQLS